MDSLCMKVKSKMMGFDGRRYRRCDVIEELPEFVPMMFFSLSWKNIYGCFIVYGEVGVGTSVCRAN